MNCLRCRSYVCRCAFVTNSQLKNEEMLQQLVSGVDQIRSRLNVIEASILKAEDKKECNHEPKEFMAEMKYRGFLASDPTFFSEQKVSEQDFFLHECKHCGVKIKAEKWVGA